MSTEGVEVDVVPGFVVPLMLALKTIPEVAAVDMKTKICVQVAVVSGLVDGYGYFCSWEMGCGALWFSFFLRVLLHCQSVRVDIELCFIGKSGVWGFFILVALHPHGANPSP